MTNFILGAYRSGTGIQSGAGALVLSGDGLDVAICDCSSRQWYAVPVGTGRPTGDLPGNLLFVGPTGGVPIDGSIDLVVCRHREADVELGRQIAWSYHAPLVVIYADLPDPRWSRPRTQAHAAQGGHLHLALTSTIRSAWFLPETTPVGLEKLSALIEQTARLEYKPIGIPR